MGSGQGSKLWRSRAGGALDELGRAQGIINIGTVHLRGKRVKPYLAAQQAIVSATSIRYQGKATR
ncbi:MAG: hypothetical protein HPY30_03935 [Gammaproteobacteria bacterium (ex Lamellibrachia satsuma)]|nr:MAG: hypothetical protein HPY30_03935 [Gammaproteobacteria bacterium (ex Lamellibrachia satsuma)]